MYSDDFLADVDARTIFDSEALLRGTGYDSDSVWRAIVAGVIGTRRDMGIKLFHDKLLARPALQALPGPNWSAC